MEAKKNLLTREGLKKYEDELHELKVIRRKEVAQKIKEAREQGDLSENAEYDAAKDEQRDIEARIEELEKILKNVEVVDMEDDSEYKLDNDKSTVNAIGYIKADYTDKEEKPIYVGYSKERSPHVPLSRLRISIVLFPACFAESC